MRYATSIEIAAFGFQSATTTVDASTDHSVDTVRHRCLRHASYSSNAGSVYRSNLDCGSIKPDSPRGDTLQTFRRARSLPQPETTGISEPVDRAFGNEEMQSAYQSKLTVRGLRASAGIELELPVPGRFGVLVGANNAGKTTVCDAADLTHRAVSPASSPVRCSPRECYTQHRR